MGNFNGKKKYHYLYKTTNLITGRYYYGMHSTNNLNNSYMGSGDLIRKSLKKYGRDNHIIEILEYCNSRNELSKKEKQLINIYEVSKKNCMNLKIGGDGGFVSEEHKNKFIEASKKTRFKSEDNPSYYKDKDMLRERFEKLRKDGKLSKNNKGFLGKSHSEESKRKIGESNKGKGISKNNAQFGSCWITNGFDNKKIKKNEIIPNGWYYGRKLN